ncbi:MAG: ImmA/IrrE family metallo-endopeptidase [Acidobacteria bacterium]|nr:ImmA/IrrE family metallo-endopeptidase [Acidobacteriota bacterium]
MHVEVSPDRFRWARERARMTSAALAKKFPKLEQWEAGEQHPTLKQLETYARATYAPIGFFFLPEPPVEAVPIPDFRTIRDAGVARPSPDLLDTLYICQQRQEWYREFARTEGESALGFIGSLTTETPIDVAADAIRTTLHFSVEERQAMGSWSEALRGFIEQADAAGILVMVSGVVGNNNRRKLSPDEFRGFALSDPFAPLVFVNGADSKAAQMFTLAHEIAHLWLGATALSDIDPRATPTGRVEQWCNQVAAELLVPLCVECQSDRWGALVGNSRQESYLSRRLVRATEVSAHEGRSTFTEVLRLQGQ